MQTYIILGVIAGVIVIFIGGISILEKKKNKKIKIERSKLEKEIKFCGENVAQSVVKIVNQNAKDLIKFVPSVGALKMSDINQKARKSLLEIKHSKNFRLLREHSNEWNDFKKNFEALLGEKSNNWPKRNQENINFFQTYKRQEEPKKETKKKRKWGKKRNA